VTLPSLLFSLALKKHYLIKLWGICVILFSLSCTSHEQPTTDKNEDVVVKKLKQADSAFHYPEISFTSIPDEGLIGLSNVFDSNDKYVVFWSDGIEKLVILNNEFKIVRTIGAYGKGPEELVTPVSIEIVDDQILVFDMAESHFKCTILN
jgi:hypothetical protein